MIDLAGSSRAWNEFWLLDDVRGGPGPTCSTSVTTVGELKSTLVLEKVVMPVAGSTWRMGLQDQALRAVALTGVAPSTIAVAHRSGETRPDVLAFAACASVVCRLRADLVEGATPVAASSASYATKVS